MTNDEWRGKFPKFGNLGGKRTVKNFFSWGVRVFGFVAEWGGSLKKWKVGERQPNTEAVGVLFEQQSNKGTKAKGVSTAKYAKYAKEIRDPDGC